MSSYISETINTFKRNFFFLITEQQVYFLLTSLIVWVSLILIITYPIKAAKVFLSPQVI